MADSLFEYFNVFILTYARTLRPGAARLVLHKYQFAELRSAGRVRAPAPTCFWPILKPLQFLVAKKQISRRSKRQVFLQHLLPTFARSVARAAFGMALAGLSQLAVRADAGL